MGTPDVRGQLVLRGRGVVAHAALVVGCLCLSSSLPEPLDVGYLVGAYTYEVNRCGIQHQNATKFVKSVKQVKQSEIILDVTCVWSLDV